MDLSLRYVLQIGQIKLLQYFSIWKVCGTNFSFAIAFLTIFKLYTHKRHQKIIKTFIPIQLSNHFLILVESEDSQLLSVPFSPCI